ncbi:MAG: NAD(P)/FAD-dependent oxidoreductase [Candidatus Bipolaricaulis sp.]|nr:NAD(P)/FAD-dependent oxidoreductase [Candidatus Bipolaricaulis sp.]
MPLFDVAIVGGGPIGTAAARAAAEEGASVVLVERRDRIEGPSPCTGLVSLHALVALGASERSIVRRIRAVVLQGPNARAVLRAEVDKAVVVDRAALERELLERAVAAGVEVRLGTAAVGAEPGVLRVQADGETSEIAARVLVGADGPRSDLAAWLGLPHPKERLEAAQVEILAEEAEDTIEVFLGRSVAPGFFAWAVPAEPGRWRVGVAVPGAQDPDPFLESLVARRFPRGRVVSSMRAPIPIPPVTPIVGDGVLLVGDAAAHVKPWSGGGLYVGGVCARLAGRTAARAAREGDASRDRLASYEDACRRAVGGELRFGSAARALLHSMTDTALDAAVTALRDRELAAFLAREADIDHPSRILSRVAAHPRIWAGLYAVWAATRRADPPEPDSTQGDLSSQTIGPV